MECFTPQQTHELVSQIGYKKAIARQDKIFVNSFMASPLLGFACALTLSVNTAPWYQENAPSLIRFIASHAFPIGLVMIASTGADLFTTNIMFLGTAFLHRRVTLADLMKSWFVSFFGNLAGMLFFMAVITGYGGWLSEPAYKAETIKFAHMKMVTPAWHQIFLRAIGANWLVCMAVWLSVSARETMSKVFAIWFSTATFVALALDHVVANMYFIPIAIFSGSPDISTSFYIWKSLIPTTLGNVAGGFIFVALPYWYLYLTGEGSVEIDFNLGGVQSAVSDNSGPLRNGHIIHGREMDTNHPASQLPHSGGTLKSQVSKELNGEDYGRSKADREKPVNNSDESV